MSVKVLEIQGKAQFQLSADEPWQTLTMESQPTIGSRFRTAPRSLVKLRVGPNSEVVLKGVGILTIGDLAKPEDANAIRTRLGMKYGNLEVEVDHVGDLRNDYQVATPGAVLAVRGSYGRISSFDFWAFKADNGNFDVNREEATGGDQASSNGGVNQTAEQQSNQNETSNTGTEDPEGGYSGTQQGSNVIDTSSGTQSQMMNQMEAMMRQEMMDDNSNDPSPF